MVENHGTNFGYFVPVLTELARKLFIGSEQRPTILHDSPPCI